MDIIKEFFGIITDAPGEIAENFTPLGKWTIWIPLSIGAIILITVVFVFLAICHAINTVTKGFIPKLYTIIAGKLIKKRKYTDTCTWPYHMDIKYAGPITPANPKFWVNKYGNHPAPFTTITQAQVESGEYKPVNESPHIKEDTTLSTMADNITNTLNNTGKDKL